MASHVATPSPPLTRPASLGLSGLRGLDLLLLATIFVASFTKLYWEPLGKVTLNNVLAIMFIGSFLLHRVRTRNASSSPEVGVLAGFAMAFASVYALGFVNVDTPEGRVQFYKAFLTSGVQLTFMVCAAAYLVERGMRFFRLAVMAFLAGFSVNAAYGSAQLAAWMAGEIDLDQVVLAKLPFSGASMGGIMHYGGGLYRINGLARDTNHFGVMLVAPAALALTWLRGRMQLLIGALIIGALLLSMSRSGAVGMAAGMLMLAVAMRGRLLRPRIIGGLALLALASVVGASLFVQLYPDLAVSFYHGRLSLDGGSAQTHLKLFGVVPPLLERAPLFGLGLNSFALYFEDISGRVGFGPHSYFIRLLVENGLLGFTVFAAFAAWLLAMLHRVGGVLAAGLAAALVGTWAGNIFYLTTHILYVEMLYAFAVAAPALLTLRYNGRTMPETTLPPRTEPVEQQHAPQHGPAPRHDEPVTFAPVWSAVRRFWWLVLAVAAAVVAIALLGTGTAPDRYEANATVYVGQPVGTNGAPLSTVSSQAATIIDVAKGDESIERAAVASGASAGDIRAGLAVTAVQPPIASKLANPPTLIRVTVRSTDESVPATAAASIAAVIVEETSSYTADKERMIGEQVKLYEQSIKELEQQRTTVMQGAQNAAGRADAALWHSLLSQTRTDLRLARTDLSKAQAELNLLNEIEESKVISEPRTSQLSAESNRPTIVFAGLAGILLGVMAAIGAARLRPSRG